MLHSCCHAARRIVTCHLSILHQHPIVQYISAGFPDILQNTGPALRRNDHHNQLTYQ